LLFSAIEDLEFLAIAWVALGGLSESQLFRIPLGLATSKPELVLSQSLRGVHTELNLLDK